MKTKKRNKQCTHFEANRSKTSYKSHAVYISHIRVNTQQAVTVLLDTMSCIQLSQMAKTANLGDELFLDPYWKFLTSKFLLRKLLTHA